MRPLTLVAIGLLVVVLDFSLSVDGFDLFPDPLGWLLVLLGCAALPTHLDRRLLAGTAVIAAAVAVALLFPSVADEVEGDPPLGWALSLPQVIFVLLLARTMARAAGEAGDESARGWWQLVLAGGVVVLLLPPVVYGAGVDSVLLLGILIGLVTIGVVMVLCVRHANRSWVRDPATRQSRPS